MNKIKITYRDRDGEVSERKVTRYKKDGGAIVGFCLKRKSVRTFLYEGIINIKGDKELLNEVKELNECREKLHNDIINRR